MAVHRIGDYVEVCLMGIAKTKATILFPLSP